MAIQGRDPRSDFNSGSTNGQTGTQHQGGFIDVAVIDLGNGTGALATIPVTRTKTTVNPSASSVQLLAADSSRVAATIVNADSAKKLYIGLNGAAATTGSSIIVPPNGTYNVPAGAVAGQVNGIWESGATGAASITATTA